VRVYQPDGSSLLGFEAVPATLEDAYLLRVQDAEQERQEAREEPALALGGAA
jgi:hypothetical protein